MTAGIPRLSIFYAHLTEAAWERELPLEAVLQKAREAGISGVDLEFGSAADALAGCTAAGLRLNSLYAFFDFSRAESLQQAEAVLDTAAPHGANVLFVPELLPEEEIAPLKRLTRREEIFGWLDRNETALRTADALEQLACSAERRGIFAAVENFDSPRSLTERRAELEWLFARAPHLKYNLDTGNAITCGEDIRELFGAFRERIVSVHCKDRKISGDRLLPAVSGDGDLPLRELRDRLLGTGYPGSFSIEMFGVTDVLAAISRAAENLQGPSGSSR